MTSTAAKKKRLQEIIAQKSIVTAKKGDNIVLPNGGKGAWLIDLRVTFMDPEGLDLIVKLFWEKFEGKLPFQVGGLEAGSVPLIGAILMEGQRRGTPVNGFFVRKERKHYGRQHVIEGTLNKHPIVVVDDVMNGGSTLDKVVVALADVKKKVRDVFVGVFYQSPRGKAYLKEKDISINYIFQLKDFGLQRSKKVTQKQSVFQNHWRFAPLELGRYFVVPKSTPVLDSQNLYFGTDSSIFWAVDQRTGQPVWQFQCGRDRQGKGIFSQPVLHRGRVYFGSYDGNVYSLDTKTGKEIWRFAEADWVGSSPAIAPDLGLLFVGLEHGTAGRHGSVVALDLKTGEKRWEYFVKELLHGSPAYCKERGVIAIGTNDSTLLLFDAATGRRIWQFRAKGSIKYRPVFDLKRNTVIAGSHDGKIYVIDLETGKGVWSVQTEDVIYSTPLIVRDRAYITSTDKRLYILDLRSKQLITKIWCSGRLFSSPRLIQGRVYWGSTDGRVYELDPRTDKITGRVQLPERITNSVVYSPQTKLYYALSYDNQLFSFKKLS